MVKQKIMIKGITEKTGQSGKTYFVIDTDQGKMSCFPDYSGLTALKDAWKNDTSIEVNMEVSDDGKFKNLRDDKGGAETIKPKDFGGSVTNVSPREVVDKPSFYVSYAKDIFIEMYDREAMPNSKIVMETAIELVKQAKTAFSENGK